MPQGYEVRHEGPAIICGSAPSVFVDLEKARQLRPGATILGVNAAAGMIGEIEHIWTQHNNLTHIYREAANRPIKIHARSGIMGNDVDYWWQEMVGIKGSSGLAGALWAKLMGFDEVIMAGIPLSTSEQDYSDKYLPDIKKYFPDRTAGSFATEASILNWQQFVRLYKKQGKADGIYSMSGYTRKVFGPPPGLED
jgi:hypothetical protein